MTHSSKWTLELISCVFPFADLLLVRGMVLLPPAPPVFSAGCHKGQFGTFRGKYADSLRSPFTVKLLDKRIPANSFVIPFFPLSHTLQVNIPFWELRQAENNAIYSRWMMVCVYVLCIYLCVSFVPLLFKKYLLLVYWGMTGDTKLIAVIIIATIYLELNACQYYVKHLTYMSFNSLNSLATTLWNSPIWHFSKMSSEKSRTHSWLITEL